MAENGDEPGGAPVLWMSISQIARLRGVKPQSIHEKVVRLVDSGLLQTRPGRGRERLIDVAQFDRAVGENRERVTVRDEVEAQASPRAPAESDPSTRRVVLRGDDLEPDAPRAAEFSGLTRAKTATEVYRARLAQLEYEERVGRLVPIDEVSRATAAFGEVFVKILEMPLQRIEPLMAAAARGVSDYRAALRALITEQRARSVTELQKLPAAAAKPEQPDAEPDE
jgi:hypothetical protein